jgi:hypothetical protein
VGGSNARLAAQEGSKERSEAKVGTAIDCTDRDDNGLANCCQQFFRAASFRYVNALILNQSKAREGLAIVAIPGLT